MLDIQSMVLSPKVVEEICRRKQQKQVRVSKREFIRKLAFAKRVKELESEREKKFLKVTKPG